MCLDESKNSNSTKSCGGFTMCSNPYNLTCIPKSLNLPFSFIGSRQNNTSYTMEKQLGRNLTLPGAQLLMDLDGQHTFPQQLSSAFHFSFPLLQSKSSWASIAHSQENLRSRKIFVHFQKKPSLIRYVFFVPSVTSPHNGSKLQDCAFSLSTQSPYMNNILSRGTWYHWKLLAAY